MTSRKKRSKISCKYVAVNKTKTKKAQRHRDEETMTLEGQVRENSLRLAPEEAEG